MEVQPIRSKKHLEKIKTRLSATTRDSLWFVLGINTGMRIGDILALDVEHLIDEKNKPRPSVSIKEQKTGKWQSYSLEAPNVQKAIRAHLGNYKGDRKAPVFIGREGKGLKPITRQYVWQMLTEAATQAGVIENVGTHTMRKTFGYFAFKNGTDVAILMELFNHSSQRFTLRYIGITQEEKDNVRIGLNL